MSLPALPTPPSPHRFTPAAFLRTAVPMVVSRAGLAAMGIADGLMVSRYDHRNFAFLSLAEGTLGRVLDVCLAFLIGGLVLVPRHVARGDGAGARLLWRRTVPVSLLLGAAGCAAGLLGRPLLSLLGQRPELASGAAPVMAILGTGFPAALVAVSAAVYLEGVGRPVLVAAAVITANLINLSANWLLIGGHLGLPAMGASGSALSTTVVRFALGLLLGAYAWRSRPAQAASHGVVSDENHDAERLRSMRSQWHLGFGTAGTVAVMVVLTSSLTIFAGWLGVRALAAFAATWGVAAPVALVALGLSDAAGIYVSAEAGRSGTRGAAAVTSTALLVSLCIVSSIAAVMALLANTWAGLYTADPTMRRTIGSAIPLAAAVVLVDAAGFVMAASLRSIKDVAWPAGIEVGSMALLVPVAAGLALARGMGIRGLFLAMLTAGVLRAGLLGARFYWRAARPGTASAAAVPVQLLNEVGA